jgi:hypothetical protein
MKGATEIMAGMNAEVSAHKKPYERRAAKLKASLWRPMSDRPDADTMVLLLVVPDGDEPYVTAAHDSGSCWRCALGAQPIYSRKAGWMHMDTAVKILNKGVRQGGAE